MGKLALVSHDDPAVALRPYGWDERLEALFADAPEGTVPGRITSAARGRVFVQTPSGTVQATANEGGWHDHSPTSPTTGDWVAIDLPGGGDLGTIAAIAPRTSCIARVDALGRDEQLLAANVDTVLIVHGLDRPLKPGRIERSLVLAWDSGAVPAIVVAKADLAAPEEAAEVLDEVAAIAGSTPVHLVSAKHGEGVDELHRYLEDDHTIVLLGESGSGKSTLANFLVGDDVQETGGVRAGDAKGRHTTTSRDLLLVPGGGVLIDTPGLRGLGLWDASEGIARAFADIEELAAGCRFRDCAHEVEPGCAVRAAAEAGDLDPDRLERYVRLQHEAAELEARRDAVARRERERQLRLAQRAYRKGPKRRT